MSRQDFLKLLCPAVLTTVMAFSHVFPKLLMGSSLSTLLTVQTIMKKTGFQYITELSLLLVCKTSRPLRSPGSSQLTVLNKTQRSSI